MDIQEHLINISKFDCIPPNHVNYLRSLKESGFEPKVIYDIGSCVLYWTKVAKQFWPDAKYILFDAFQAAEFLYKDYDYHIGVLSNKDNEIVHFYQNDIYPGGNSYYREIGCEDGKYFPVNEYKEYTTARLDTIVSKRNFPLPDLVKIDTQGSEHDIINGAISTLSNAKHMIVEMQHVNYNDGAPTVDQTLPYIESLGWKCVAPCFQNNGPDGDYGFIKEGTNGSL